MGELKLPELWYAKAHMPTERIFKDYFCDKIAASIDVLEKEVFK